MIGTINVKEYVALTASGGKSEMRKSLARSWAVAGRFFHANLRDRRFTLEHAKKAGYAPRKGQQQGIGTKAFFRSYTGRKLKRFGHMRPLEWSGETRKAVRMANISSTSNGARVAYAGARAFNFRNPNSDPTMNLNLEFRKVLPEEGILLAKEIESTINTQWLFDELKRKYVRVQ